MRKLLIIFIKNPIAGRVKTRLARSIGDEAALQIYHELLNHTHQVSSALSGVDRAVYYSDFVNISDLWETSAYQKFLQTGEDLGERMYQAFQHSFSRGYTRAVIIGSDCAELTPAILEDAFQSLENHDFVLGPALDGGYYLLGMNQLEESIFRNKKWSTQHVLSDTMQDLQARAYSYHLLPKLSDIDELKDWEAWKKRSQD